MTPSLLLAAFRHGLSFLKFLGRSTVFLVFGLCYPVQPAAAQAVPATSSPAFRSGDVVAFIGGEDVAAQRESGHLESLLSIKFPGVRFRNLGWEGDTVFAQPRDVGFPDLASSIKSSGATVVVAQFGRTEALNGEDKARFVQSYGKLLDVCAAVAPRLVLVTPPPYENGGGFLPDLSIRNTNLAAYAEAIRKLASRRSIPVVDLFAELEDTIHRGGRLTSNGLQLSARGQGLAALAFARQLGLSSTMTTAEQLNPDGSWKDARLEQLRELVMAKDILWFNYYRPQNWAFLGGDRISQPSSRDHLNPKIRWFPQEMEKFVPLIRGREEEIEKLASSLRKEFP